MLVIADDITGAAEIAGIAFRQGQQVRLFCGSSTYDATNGYKGITVIATDTRSMTEAEAVAEMKHIISSIIRHPSFIFKKTDSALRGHVVAELTSLMQSTGYCRAVYLPANPSKGRIISDGVYFINGKPIHETDFSFDPEFPARTSSLKERFPNAEGAGIIMPDAESLDDIRRIIETYNDGKTLFAGAADLFALLVEPETKGTKQEKSIEAYSRENTLILCGSTQSKPLNLGIPLSHMPREVYDGSSDLSRWDTTGYQEQHSLILSIPHTHRTGKKAAVHLRTVMAEMTRQLVTKHCPGYLIIEGGATAWATLQALGWNEFDVVRQIAPGVVQMRATCGTLVTLKPGSYPWGGLFTR